MCSDLIHFMHIIKWSGIFYTLYSVGQGKGKGCGFVLYQSGSVGWGTVGLVQLVQLGGVCIV